MYALERIYSFGNDYEIKGEYNDNLFPERGDGRWKKKDGNLQHDIELFRRMAGKFHCDSS